MPPGLIMHKKTTAEQYRIHTDKYGEYAIITIAEDIGLLQISSDWGDWSFSWGYPGMPFKEFLTKINKDQLIYKLTGGKREYCAHETEQAALSKIIYHRRGYPRFFDKEEAREMWDSLKGNDCFASADLMWFELLKHEYAKVFDWETIDDCVQTKVTENCGLFYDKLYKPVFVPIIESEILNSKIIARAAHLLQKKQ